MEASTRSRKATPHRSSRMSFPLPVDRKDADTPDPLGYDYFEFRTIRRRYHMSSVSPTDADASRARRRTMNRITDGIRELGVVMTVLNLRAGEQVGLRDVEMKALDVLMREGAMSAKALGQRLAMPPATMTGILDKLEKGGWITRERDPDDRRVVLIQPVRERVGEIVRLF